MGEKKTGSGGCIHLQTQHWEGRGRRIVTSLKDSHGYISSFEEPELYSETLSQEKRQCGERKLGFKKGTSWKQVSSELKFNFINSYSRKDLLFINICPLNLTYFLWYKKISPESFETDSHVAPAGQKFQHN